MRYNHFDMLPERAFQRDVSGKIKPQGGGGGSSSPSKSTVTQTNIPEYARPYAEETLGRAQALTDINQNPFQPYSEQRFAGFSPMQAQAFQNISQQQVSPQITDASNIAYTASGQALGAQPISQALQQTALGYGQAGAGYGGAASTLGIAGAQAAQLASQEAQRRAGMYGQMGAQAGQVGMGYGAQGAQQAGQVAGAAGQQAQMYGGLGAGYGGAATTMVPQAQMYGGTAAGLGLEGYGYGQQGAGIGGLGVQAAQQGFGAGQAYAQQATSPEAQQAYMSPYMQNVVKQQQEDARRQALISRQAEQAQAVKQGAFGGSRSAIVEAESRKNLEDRLAQIQAAGSQQAFQQAQQAQQFGAGLGIQGLQAGYQGLQTGLAGTAQGMQGAQTGIQGQQVGLSGIQQAGQLYGLGMQGAGLGLQGVGQQIAAGQLGLAGTAQGMQGAQTGIQGAQAGLQGVGQQIAGGQLGLAGAQTGIQGQQAGIQGAQAGMQGVGQAIGAGQYGLQGAQTAISGAGQLGQLGQTQYAQEMGITDALQKYGALQQQQQQQQLDFAYQQYLAQQQYPYQQLSYMSDILRGVPSTQSAVYQYQQQPAVAPQLLGAGISALGAYGRPAGQKEGGVVRKYAVGGQVTPEAMQTMAVQEMPSKLRRLSDSQLAAYARSVKDAITLSAINSELDRRTKARMPMGGVQDTTVADDIAKRAEAASLGGGMRMYGGGIVALQQGGMPDDMALDVDGGETQVEPTVTYDGEDPAMTAEGASAPAAPAAPPTTPQAPVAKGGIGGLSARQALAKQYENLQAKKEPDANQAALLDDMRSRIDKKLGSAEKTKDVAVYDAMIAAGLAMMSGKSLTDGIAKAAQAGGASYFSSKKEADKAISAAQDAEIAFRKYQLELEKGDKAAADKSFNEYVKNAVDLTKAEAMGARGGAGAVSAEDKAYNTAMIRVQGDKAIAGWLKLIDDPLTPPDQKAALTRQINERARSIFGQLKIADKYTPLPEIAAPAAPPEKPGFWSRLFGSSPVPPQGSAVPPPPPGFQVQ